MLTGCTESPEATVFSEATVPASSAVLGDTAVAFYVAPAKDEMYTPVGTVRKPGYVVLVEDDGSFSTIETTGMDLGTLAWNRHGLYFADDERDYRLAADGLATAPSEKPTGQNLMFALETGESVGVYNDGFTEEGYSNRVSVAADGVANVYDIEGNYFGGGDCDGRIFGLAAEPGTHADEAASLPDMQSSADPSATPQMLARLHPASGDGREEVIAWRDAFTTTISGHLPCRDSTLVFVNREADADGVMHDNLVTWNVDTGAHRTVPMVFADDATLAEDAVDYAYFDADSLAGDRFEWVAADGRVLSTAIDTGATEVVFDTGLDHQAGSDTASIWAFSESKIHAVEMDYTDDDGFITYHAFDRATGTETSVPIAIKNSEINVSYLGWWRMAARPE